MRFLLARGVWWCALVAVLAGVVALVLPAAGAARAGKAAKYPYTLVDLPTLGGPRADATGFPGRILTANGLVTGNADTATTDPYEANENPAFCCDGYVAHGFVWRSGAITDMGALGSSAQNSSASSGVNARGDVGGQSDNGVIDPLLGYVEERAVFWQDGHLTDLGTLGGTESAGFDINNADEVVGAASNTVPDQFSLNGWGTQTRAFAWQHGTMRDLGTLGGPDAVAFITNDAGDITGVSYTNSTPNSTTGIPTLDPFLWRHGHMQDLGTLGGTTGFATWMNEHGEVVGGSNLPGDQTQHPYLWNGKTMIDLGTLGGDNGQANWINNAGDVVGSADLPSGSHDGFFWARDQIRDLPPVGAAACSNAFHVNDVDAVVGNATDCHGTALAAVLWQNGVGTDLNALVAPSNLHLTEADSINDRGEIEGLGRLPNGDQHEFLLIPNH
jgi:probable HAF family extracellular repeat protein